MVEVQAARHAFVLRMRPVARLPGMLSVQPCAATTVDRTVVLRMGVRPVSIRVLLKRIVKRVYVL